MATFRPSSEGSFRKEGLHQKQEQIPYTARENDNDAQLAYQSIVVIGSQVDPNAISQWRRCFKRCCSHRVLWFALLLPVYVLFLFVTALCSVLEKRTDGNTKSFADNFFAIVYFVTLTTCLALLLRYIYLKCDKRCTCSCPSNVYISYGDRTYRRQEDQFVEIGHQPVADSLSSKTLSPSLCPSSQDSSPRPTLPHPCQRPPAFRYQVVDVDGNHTLLTPSNSNRYTQASV